MYKLEPFCFYYKVVSNLFSATNNQSTWVLSHFLCPPVGITLPFSSSLSPVHPGCDGGFCTNGAQSECSGLTGWLTGLLSNQLTFPMVPFMFLSCLAPHSSHDISPSKIYTAGAPPGFGVGGGGTVCLLSPSLVLLLKV